MNHVAIFYFLFSVAPILVSAWKSLRQIPNLISTKAYPPQHCETFGKRKEKKTDAFELVIALLVNWIFFQKHLVKDRNHCQNARGKVSIYGDAKKCSRKFAEFGRNFHAPFNCTRALRNTFWFHFGFEGIRSCLHFFMWNQTDSVSF